MYELTIHDGGTAILTDHAGKTVWTSDADEEFLEEFDAHVSIEDADDVAEYLYDADYVPEDEEIEIVEADESGLYETLSDDDDDDDEEEDDEPEVLQ